jgi:hypothetical protein
MQIPAENGTDDLRERCVRTLATVTMPQGLDESSFAEAIERHTGRHVVISTAQKARLQGASGLLARGYDQDYVWVATEANELTRVIVLAHEFGHLLSDHATPGIPDPLLQIYGPDRVLLQGNYSAHFNAKCFQEISHPKELEAEMFARLIIESISGGGGTSKRPRSGGRAVLAKVFAS